MTRGSDRERRGALIWCAGLPYAEERRLDREELEHLRHSAWRLLRQGLGAFLGVLVAGILLMALTSLLGGAWGGTLVVIAVIFASLLVVLPLTLFAQESRTQRGLALFRDLRRGEVTVFSGLLTESDRLLTEDAADSAQGRLLALGLLTLDGKESQTLEVLPVSRRVWRVGEERVSPWVEAHSKEVAVSGDFARPVVSEGGGDRRRLSDRERAELLREAHQHWLRPCVVATFLTIWCLVVLILGAATVMKAGLRGLPLSAWGSIHLIWITSAADVFFLRRWGQARKMYLDARSGEVWVSRQGGRAVLETLPHSGRLWTEAEKPAAWRRIGR